jgi:hypothetical protein
MGAIDTPDDPLIVLIENRGTCSTKHALIRRLAMEQDLDIALVLGMYEMTEQNTPGIGNVLRKYGLAMLPEAHCHLRTSGKRIDLTRDIGRRGRGEEIVGFLYKEDIDPNQITHYKTELTNASSHSGLRITPRLVGAQSPRCGAFVRNALP